MKTDAERYATLFREIELLGILRSCGLNVVFAPVRYFMPDGSEFVWHKPFIDEKKALEARDLFIRQQNERNKATGDKD